MGEGLKNFIVIAGLISESRDRRHLSEHDSAAELIPTHLGRLEHGWAHHRVADEPGPQVVGVVVRLLE